MEDPSKPPDVRFVLTARDGDPAGTLRTEVYMRDGMTGAAFADLLRRLADSFEDGSAKRVG